MREMEVTAGAKSRAVFSKYTTRGNHLQHDSRDGARHTARQEAPEHGSHTQLGKILFS